jgi:hypothetical protein
MRRRLLPVLLVAVGVQLVGMARSPLPSQDGLKFLRVAREFQSQPWPEVVRASDQHPLYPALVALAEPAVRPFLGRGPDAWRIAAQLVSAVAAVLALIPLWCLARALFDDRTATLAALLFALLPATAGVAHETLSDSLALALAATALACGEGLLRNGRRGAAVGCGLASGLGYWARPEVAVVGVVVLVVGGLRAMGGLRHAGAASWLRREFPPGAAVAVSFLGLVGAYALVKGEVSEKLALRRAAGVASVHDTARRAAPLWLPPGLDDPRWDFSPKEEGPTRAPTGLAAGAALALARWSEQTLSVLGLLALGAVVLVPAGPGKILVGTFAAVFGALLARHAATFGYLSDRHVLALVLVTLPWAAAGMLGLSRRVADRRGWPEARRARLRLACAALLVAAGLAVQAKPAHASRWGHRAAGAWLAAHAEPAAAVLDTRGWAAFLSGRSSYDMWHVRQALGDAKLRYVVVGADELDAESRRGATLRAVLGYAGELAAAFPARAGEAGRDVLVYRFDRPASWEGLRP